MARHKIKYAILAFFVIGLLVSFQNKSNIVKDKNPIYLNANAPIKDRVSDLMARMTLEDKVYQMCQYVGLEHMKHAENNISAADLEKNDALGFYPGMLSKDVAKLATEGKIGSFLHVVTPEEANKLTKISTRITVENSIINWY